MKFCFTIILFLILSVLAISTEAQVSSSQDSLKVDGQAFKFEEPVTFEGCSAQYLLYLLPVIAVGRFGDWADWAVLGTAMGVPKCSLLIL